MGSMKNMYTHETDTKRSKGFTIIEAFVAISVLLVAITGPLVLVSLSLKASFSAKEQMIGVLLAQEGIEYVRNKRDTNILAGNDWLDGLSGASYCGGSDGCIVDAAAEEIAACSGGCKTLLYDPQTGLYGYTSGEESSFTRSIIVTEAVADREAEVVSTVFWKIAGITHTVIVRDRLFAWR